MGLIFRDGKCILPELLSPFQATDILYYLLRPSCLHAISRLILDSSLLGGHAVNV